MTNDESDVVFTTHCDVSNINGFISALMILASEDKVFVAGHRSGKLFSFHSVLQVSNDRIIIYFENLSDDDKNLLVNDKKLLEWNLDRFFDNKNY